MNGLSFTALPELIWESSEAYPESCHTSKMEGFAKVVNGFHSLTIYAKHSTLDVWQGLKYAFGHDHHDLYHLF